MTGLLLNESLELGEVLNLLFALGVEEVVEVELLNGATGRSISLAMSRTLAPVPNNSRIFAVSLRVRSFLASVLHRSLQ